MDANWLGRFQLPDGYTLVEQELEDPKRYHYLLKDSNGNVVDAAWANGVGMLAAVTDKRLGAASALAAKARLRAGGSAS